MVAAATLLLTGCGDGDDSGSPFAGIGQAPGGEQEGDGGEADAPPPTSEEGADPGEGGGSGADFDGYWTLSGTGESSLNITGGNATFVESTDAEGDVCYGSVSGSTLTIECTQFGEQLFPETGAELSLSGSTLDVTWSSGTTQTYEGLGAGLEDLPEMPDLEDIPDLEDMPDLGDMPDLSGDSGRSRS
ncbi:hypothetical protein CAG99_10630 [Streptomyces marincola]|uniref:Uncharacterized protein n=1 Tax=Streptomyces marincola TaxID=2878388 RepID=A0A1W7CWT4_9ACTN|nr:hypothetical protein CAG99_10630 [Streptomyces marincola]